MEKELSNNNFLEDFEIDEFEEIEEIEEIETQTEENSSTIENEEIEYIERPITELSFSNFPSIIKNRIIYSSVIIALINVLLIGVLIVFKFKVNILVILLFIDLVGISKIYYDYLITKTMEFRIFDGFVVSCDIKGIPGTSSSYKRIVMCNEDESIFLSFDYRGKSKICHGFPLSVYLSRNEQVKLVDDTPYIENILGVTFGERKEKLDIFETERNVDDFLS